MKLLVKNDKALDGLASLYEEYYGMIEELKKREVEYPIVIILLKPGQEGLVESDDEFFKAWAISTDTEDYDWDSDDLYSQLFKDYIE